MPCYLALAQGKSQWKRRRRGAKRLQYFVYVWYIFNKVSCIVICAALFVSHYSKSNFAFHYLLALDGIHATATAVAAIHADFAVAAVVIAAAAAAAATTHSTAI